MRKVFLSPQGRPSRWMRRKRGMGMHRRGIALLSPPGGRHRGGGRRVTVLHRRGRDGLLLLHPGERSQKRGGQAASSHRLWERGRAGDVVRGGLLPLYSRAGAIGRDTGRGHKCHPQWCIRREARRRDGGVLVVWMGDGRGGGGAFHVVYLLSSLPRWRSAGREGSRQQCGMRMATTAPTRGALRG